MKHYIGLDAHSKTCTFVVLDSRGKETNHQKLKTSESEILRFVRSLNGKKSLTFEESHLSKWLYTILKEEVDKLVVCDPSYISRRRGPKDDYPDSLHLAQQLRGDFLTPVFHQDNFYTELRSMVSAYEDIVKDLTRLKNRYKALFRSEALDTTGKALFQDEKRIKELGQSTSRFVAKQALKQIELSNAIKSEYLKCFNEYGKASETIRALTSIPGIATVRGVTIAAIVCSPERFASKFKFWAYSMLVKYDKKSDNRSYGKQRVPGNRLLKCAFMGAAETALLGKSEFRTYYDKMREAGIEHRAAKKNVARKIAAIALAIMKSKKPYDPARVNKTKA